MEEITGIVLAGGQSKRFKSPKYLARIGGRSLLDITVSKLVPLCKEVLIVSKEPLSQPKAKNIIEDTGEYHPLAGITKGLESSTTEQNIVLACDTPFISQSLLKALTETVAKIKLYRYKKRFEPLLGMYSKSCLDCLRDYKNRKIIDVLKDCDFDYIEEEKDNLAFFNINTREDLDEAQKIAQSDPQILSN